MPDRALYGSVTITVISLQTTDESVCTLLKLFARDHPVTQSILPHQRIDPGCQKRAGNYFHHVAEDEREHRRHQRGPKLLEPFSSLLISQAAMAKAT